MGDEIEEPKDDNKETPPVSEGEPKRKPGRPPKSKDTPPSDDTNSEPTITVETFAEITPMGWFLFIGTIVVLVGGYSWYKKRKEAGKGMLPDALQNRMRPEIVGE